MVRAGRDLALRVPVHALLRAKGRAPALRLQDVLGKGQREEKKSS